MLGCNSQGPYSPTPSTLGGSTETPRGLYTLCTVIRHTGEGPPKFHRDSGGGGTCDACDFKISRRSHTERQWEQFSDLPKPFTEGSTMALIGQNMSMKESHWVTQPGNEPMGRQIPCVSPEPREEVTEPSPAAVAYPRSTFCILRAAALASSSESDSLWEVEPQGEEHSGEHR